METNDLETNLRLNTVKRDFIMDGSRYQFDETLTRAEGWKQYDTDQDAWYFGVWVNVDQRKVFTYAEGDTTEVSCPTVESFKAELAAMTECYGDPPPAFRVYSEDDNGVWTKTLVYDTRPSV